jgi:hypothetical protein
MKIFLPSSIYSAILGIMLPDDLKSEIEIVPASLITDKLVNTENSIGLIPSMDLLKNNKLHVSKKIALSFDGALSQSYFYFMPDQNKFDKVLLRGDVTSNEVILSKILFAEKYGFDSEIVLDTNMVDFEEDNYLISGQENNDVLIKRNGVSFADQVADYINYPYVNFLLSSSNDELIKELVSKLSSLDEKVEDEIFSILDKFSFDDSLKKYIAENIDTVYFEMTDNEVEGLNELLKLPYYHGVIEDLIEVKFV